MTLFCPDPPPECEISHLFFSVAIATIRTRFFHVDILKSMWIYYYIVLVYPHYFQYIHILQKYLSISTFFLVYPHSVAISKCGYAKKNVDIMCSLYPSLALSSSLSQAPSSSIQDSLSYLLLVYVRLYAIFYQSMVGFSQVSHQFLSSISPVSPVFLLSLSSLSPVSNYCKDSMKMVSE